MRALHNAGGVGAMTWILWRQCSHVQRQPLGAKRNSTITASDLQQRAHYLCPTEPFYKATLFVAGSPSAAEPFMPSCVAAVAARAGLSLRFLDVSSADALLGEDDVSGLMASDLMLWIGSAAVDPDCTADVNGGVAVRLLRSAVADLLGPMEPSPPAARPALALRTLAE